MRGIMQNVLNPKTGILESIIISKFGIASFLQIEDFVKLQEGQTLDSMFVNNLEEKLYRIISEKYGDEKTDEIRLEVIQSFRDLQDEDVLEMKTIQVLNLLGDAQSRTILDFIDMPIEELDIVRVTGISKTTTHRKINLLLEAKLIQEHGKVIK